MRCGACHQYKKCSWLPGGAGPAPAPVPAAPVGPPPGQDVTNAAAFEDFARGRLSEQFGVSLVAMAVGRVPKVFDFVSPDGTIVGDAKFYSLVNGTGLPPAKFSAIAEHVSAARADGGGGAVPGVRP